MQNPETIDWLLAAKTPTIRYLTRRDLLHLPPDNDQLRRDYQDIQTSPAVTEMLSHQTADGRLAGDHNYYQPKYYSTHWSMLLLAELNLDPGSEPYRKAAAYMLADTSEVIHKQREKGMGFSCLWGNILRYSLPAVGLDDPRIQYMVEFTLDDLANDSCRCEYNDWLPCSWGVIRTLWGLAAIPADRRSARVQAAVDNAVEFLLSKHSLVEANYPVPQGGKVHSLWRKVSFPLFYQTDILFTLRVLADLDKLDHPGARPALDWLRSRRKANGRWRGSSPYRRRTWTHITDEEDTERWINLQILQLLERAPQTA